ncbi:hypothetical protein PALB_37340 [Pseudoalteromonas luteoviolacea B = ATCC 29581]|nr:hypothetical protein PALB_37340 [Pseudoalteromonas luteoviolacea B = ATCC 29581]
MFKVQPIVLISLLLIACSTETTESDKVATNAIWADFQAISDGYRTRLVAELNVDGPYGNNVKLTDGDSLYATANGETKELVEDIDFFDVDYQAYFYQITNSTTLSVIFDRQQPKQRMVSTVALPEPFTVFSPQTRQAFKSDEDTYLSWSGLASNKTIQLDYQLKCAAKEGGQYNHSGLVDTIVDDGNHRLFFSQIDALKNSSIDTNRTCELDLMFTRSNNGIIDSKYASGSRIQAHQVRKIEALEIYF